MLLIQKMKNLILNIKFFFFAIIFLAKYQIGTLIFHSPEIYRYQIGDSLLDIINYSVFDSAIDYLRVVFNSGIFGSLSYFILGYYLAKSGIIKKIDNLKIKHLMFINIQEPKNNG